MWNARTSFLYAKEWYARRTWNISLWGKTVGQPVIRYILLNDNDCFLATITAFSFYISYFWTQRITHIKLETDAVHDVVLHSLFHCQISEKSAVSVPHLISNVTPCITSKDPKIIICCLIVVKFKKKYDSNILF